MASMLPPTTPVLIETIPGNLDKVPAAGPDLGAGGGVQAIEIVDGSPRGLTQSHRDRARIDTLVNKLNLAVVSGSDNHGYGRAASAWTLIRIPGWRGMSGDSLSRRIEEVIRNGRKDATRVAERRTAESNTPTSVVLAGPAVAWRMLTTLVARRARDVDRVDVGDRGNRRGRAPASARPGAGVTTGATATHDGRWKRAMLVVSVAAVIRLVFAALLPVFPDEAYYWEWSRRLAPSYFDHPPVVALLIRFGTTFFGATPLGIRLGSILAGWVASLFTIAIAARLGDARTALRSAVVMSVLPLAAAGLVLATPDAPLLACTAATLYFVVRSLEVDSSSSLRWWLAAGVALGVAFLSKYTAILLPLGVLISFATRPSLRARLREPGPYVACVVAALVFMPVVVWNARHEWVSFAFQLKHGLSAPQGSALVAAWKHEGDLFGGQAALVSPILFVLMGVMVWRSFTKQAADAERVLGVVALVSFGFFAYSAVRQRVEANWPAPAYIPAIVLRRVWRAHARTRRMAACGSRSRGGDVAGDLRAGIDAGLAAGAGARSRGTRVRLERFGARRRQHQPRGPRVDELDDMDRRRSLSGSRRVGAPFSRKPDSVRHELVGTRESVRPVAAISRSRPRW